MDDDVAKQGGVRDAKVLLFDYFGVLAHRFGSPDQRLIAFIEENLAGKYRLAVLSNMSGVTPRDMLGEHLELFDEVMMSGELGVAKPDSRAFLMAANRLGELPEQIVMIDDGEINCTIATELGMQAICYKNLEQLQQELIKYGILTP